MRINRASGLKRLAILAAALGLLSLANPAAAQYLTFVSATGNDANNCLVQASPCKTLQRAINVTTARGEVRLLSRLVSSGYINKSITIDGAGNTIVGAITINSASAVVILRGLGLNGVGGYPNGINIISAAAVHIEDTKVERYTDSGIKLGATTATQLFISDTAARANGVDGVYADAVNASVVIENSLFEQNAHNGVTLKVAESSVTRSSASGNGWEGVAVTGGTANVTDTIAAENAAEGFAFFGNASATLDSSVARGNTTGLLLFDSVTSVSIADCVITSNTLRAVYNSGAFYTRQNNTVGGGIFGPAATPFGAY